MKTDGNRERNKVNGRLKRSERKETKGDGERRKR